MRTKPNVRSASWLHLSLLLSFSSRVEPKRRPDLGRPETGRLLLGGPANSRNFPYSCAIVCCGDSYTTAVSMCSIIDERYVVTSLSNLAKQSDYLGRHAMYFTPEMRPLLRVTAGIDALIPGSEIHLHEVMSKNLQKYSVLSIFVVRDNAEVYDLKKPFSESVFVNPATLSNLYNNSYDFEFPFAFIQIDGQFEWGTNVEKMPRPNADAMTELKLKGVPFLKGLNIGRSREVCFAPGWGLSHSKNIEGVRRMIYQKVVSIDINSCRNAYCTNDVTTCTKYPNQGNTFLVCFKSLHYGDMCELDQSAGIYCQNYHESVLALLATTVECGIEGVPAVYWLTPIVLLVYERIKAERKLDKKPKK